LAVASLGHANRREKVLVVLALFVALSVLRSHSVSTIDPRVADSVMRLQPLGVDGRTVPLFVLKGLYEFTRQISAASLARVMGHFAAAFATFTLLGVYFVYRELFGRRYVGVIALALAGSAPAFVSSTSVATLAVSLFFVVLSVYLWLKQSWIMWGLATGLALSSHYGSATVLLPFLGWAVWARRSTARPWRMGGGVALAVVITVSSYCWMLNAYGGFSSWVGNVLVPALQSASATTLGLPTIEAWHLVSFGGYSALALALAGAFRSSPLARRAIVYIFAIAAPYTFLMLVNAGSLAPVVGTLVWVIATVSILPVWSADPKRKEIVSLLCWIAPLLILVPLFAPGLSSLFVFALFPLALLACRLLDLTLDGEWLDFWWAAGLATDWYYRLGKAALALVLALSYIQAAS